MRTTLHGDAEDLRSYEAAVMARKAPTMLNLQVRRPMKTKGNPPGSNHPGRGDTRSESNQSSPLMSYGSRPGSNASSGKGSSTSSTLANAFGTKGNQHQPPPTSAPPSRVTFAKEESESPSLSSRDSSVDLDGNSGASDGESMRPSFKRLPSQTLGPTNSKRAFLGFSGSDVEDRERAVGWGAGVPDVKQMNNPGPRVGGMSHPDRVVASIAERRRRRMSAPSTGPTLDLGQKAGGGADMPALGYAPAPQGGMAG